MGSANSRGELSRERFQSVFLDVFERQRSIARGGLVANSSHCQNTDWYVARRVALEAEKDATTRAATGCPARNGLLGLFKEQPTLPELTEPKSQSRLQP